MASLPAFTQRGILPTFAGSDPTSPSSRSPFAVEMSDVVERLATSPERGRLLLGLNAYRRHLLAGGFSAGEQWLGGSFVEDCETRRGRPPGDIDVLTLFRRPARYGITPEKWGSDYRKTLFENYFSPIRMKARFACDTYALDLDLPPERIVHVAGYWHGLLSETRSPAERKGIIRIPLMTDENEFHMIDRHIRGKTNV